MKTAELSAAYPGERLKGVPLPPNSDIASIRSGRGNVRNAPWMLQCNRDKLAAELASYREGALDMNVLADREKLRDKLRRSIVEHNTIGAEVAAYREFLLLKDVLALPFALGAFQAINLSKDELPLIRRPKARQYFNVNYVNHDGSSRQDQWRTTMAVQQLLMTAISTDKVEYPIQDIQIGSIEEFDRVNDNVRFDMEMKIDNLALAQLDANTASSGLRALLNLHPLINANNVPDSNVLDLTDVPTYGPAHKLTMPRIKAILNHFALFGSGVQGMDADGPMQMTNIVYSPQNVRDQWDYVDLVAVNTSGSNQPYASDPQSTVLETIREQIFQNGMMTSAWGQSWTFTPNARLDAGVLYAFTNNPVGWFFTKTDFDQFIRWEGPDQVQNNFGAVMWRRVLQFAIPDLWKKNFLKVTF